MIRRKLCRRLSQHNESSNSDRLGAAGLQVRKRSANGRACVEDVVDDGYALAKHHIAKCARQTILYRVKCIPGRICEPLCICERQAEFLSDHQCDERSFHERPAYHLYVVRHKALGDLCCLTPDPFRPQAQ